VAMRALEAAGYPSLVASVVEPRKGQTPPGGDGS
jgi:hypothetical protein